MLLAGKMEYKYRNDNTFEQTVKILTTIFGECTHTFRKRFRCLPTVKSNHVGFISYSMTVNRRCEEFNIASTKADQFKCLDYVCGLQLRNGSEIRMRRINRLELEQEKMTQRCSSTNETA